MSAQEELESLQAQLRWIEAAIRSYDRPGRGNHRIADKIAAIREGLGKAQEPAAWVNLDARFANHERYATTDKEDADDYSASCYQLTPVYLAPPADSAQVLVDALRLAHDHMRLYLPHYTENHNVYYAVTQAIAANKSKWNTLACTYCDNQIENGQKWRWLQSGTRAVHDECLAAHKSEGKG